MIVFKNNESWSVWVEENQFSLHCGSAPRPMSFFLNFNSIKSFSFLHFFVGLSVYTSCFNVLNAILHFI
jgi:hypothetical protein